jgi:hypothetical protein
VQGKDLWQTAMPCPGERSASVQTEFAHNIRKSQKCCSCLLHGQRCSRPWREKVSPSRRPHRQRDSGALRSPGLCRYSNAGACCATCRAMLSNWRKRVMAVCSLHTGSGRDANRQCGAKLALSDADCAHPCAAPASARRYAGQRRRGEVAGCR